MVASYWVISIKTKAPQQNRLKNVKLFEFICKETICDLIYYKMPDQTKLLSKWLNILVCELWYHFCQICKRRRVETAKKVHLCVALLGRFPRHRKQSPSIICFLRQESLFNLYVTSLRSGFICIYKCWYHHEKHCNECRFTCHWGSVRYTLAYPPLLFNMHSNTMTDKSSAWYFFVVVISDRVWSPS